MARRSVLRRGIPLLVTLLFNSGFSLVDKSNLGSSARHSAANEANSNRTAISSTSKASRSPRVRREVSHSDKDRDLSQKKRSSHDGRDRNKSSSVSGGTTDSLRRIRSEWRSVVKSGNAYQWKRGRPIRPEQSAPLSPSHMWLGPLDDRNLYVWHFTIVGLPGSPYDSGLYHGRIVLPRSYPLQPPRVQMWTESGRFVPRMDICLSASAYHPETWSPNHWSLRTLVEGLRLHMATTAFEVGGMNAPYEQRLAFASASLTWKKDFPLSSGVVVTVDHDRMINQGLFAGYLNHLPEERRAAHNRSDDTISDEDDLLYDSASVQKQVTESSADKGKKRKRKRKRAKRQSRVETATNSKQPYLGAALQRQAVKMSIGDRIVVLSLLVGPWLVGAWLWRLLLGWALG